MTMEDKIDFLMDSFIEVKEKVMTMEDKINFLMNSFIEMNGRFKKMEETMNDMKKDITHMQQDITGMQKDITNMKEHIRELREDHERMNGNLILIQEDTSTKIPALFDGYSFHQQHIEQHDKRIDTL